VSDEIVPAQNELRMSDAERERVVGWLHAAVTEGRLSLTEFSERVQGVLSALTYADVQRYVRDLPPAGAPSALVAADPVELVSNADQLTRFGDWVVPPRMVVRGRDGTIRLDFRTATIRYPVIEITVDLARSTCRFLVPPGATVDMSEVTTSIGRASCKLPAREGDPAAGPRFVVRGRVRFSTLRIRRR
jgi:hypothetical protein